MKKTNYLAKTCLGAFLLMFWACQPQENAHHQHQDAQKTQTPATPAASTKASKEDLQAILEKYLLLKDQLVASNATESQKVAVQTLELFKNTPQDEQSIQTLKENLDKISQSQDLEIQRVAFEPVSENLYALLKGSQAQNKKLYQQYCPMAFNDKGAAWISDKPEIRNPYFGDQMLKCGEVKEELEVAQ